MRRYIGLSVGLMALSATAANEFDKKQALLAINDAKAILFGTGSAGGSAGIQGSAGGSASGNSDSSAAAKGSGSSSNSASARGDSNVSIGASGDAAA